MFRWLLIWIIGLAVVCGDRSLTLQRNHNGACFSINHSKRNTALKVGNLISSSQSIPFCSFEFEDISSFNNLPDFNTFLQLNTTLEESSILTLNDNGELEVKLNLIDPNYAFPIETTHTGFIDSDTSIPILKSGIYCIYFPWVYHGGIKSPETFTVDISIVNERPKLDTTILWTSTYLVIIIYYCSYIKKESFQQYSKCTTLVLYCFVSAFTKEVIYLLISYLPHLTEIYFITHSFRDIYRWFTSVLINFAVEWVHLVIFMGYGSLYRFKIPSFVYRKASYVALIGMAMELTNYNSGGRTSLSYYSYIMPSKMLVGKDHVANIMIEPSSFESWYIHFGVFVLSVVVLYNVASYIISIHYSISTYKKLQLKEKLVITKKFKRASIYYFFISPILGLVFKIYFSVGYFSTDHTVAQLLTKAELMNYQDAYIFFKYFHLFLFWLIWANERYEPEPETIELAQL